MTTATTKALGALGDLVPAREAPALIDRFLDVTAEFTFATVPIYRRFPGIWNAEVKAAATQVPPRTAESDKELSQVGACARHGQTERARAVVSRANSSPPHARPAARTRSYSIGWAHERGGKNRTTRIAARIQARDWTSDAYSRRQVPPDVIETIGGLPLHPLRPRPCDADWQDDRLSGRTFRHRRQTPDGQAPWTRAPLPPDVPGRRGAGA